MVREHAIVVEQNAVAAFGVVFLKVNDALERKTRFLRNAKPAILCNPLN